MKHGREAGGGAADGQGGAGAPRAAGQQGREAARGGGSGEECAALICESACGAWNDSSVLAKELISSLRRLL
eukprot:2406256-Pleurochrysis_carterae.AAC.1